MMNEFFKHNFIYLLLMFPLQKGIAQNKKYVKLSL